MAGPDTKTRGGKSTSKVGLDIGTYAVKALEVSGASGKPTLTALGTRTIRGLSRDETVNAIKALAEESKISYGKAGISVSGPMVIVRLISMPKMRDDELKNALKFEAEKFIPFDIKDCIIDFQIVKKAAAVPPAVQKPDAPEGNKVDVLLAAARRSYVEDKIKLAGEAGFSVNMVDVDTLALANCFIANFPDLGPGKSVAVLNVGNATTNLSIIRASSLCFTRDVPIGGNQVTLTIAKELGVDSGEAEKIKLQPGENLQKVTDCGKTAFSGLIDDIKMSFSYYENQSGSDIDEIYITGGDLSIAALNDIFLEVFGSKPIIWNPLGFMDTSSSGIDAATMERLKGQFGVAAGLCLR